MKNADAVALGKRRQRKFPEALVRAWRARILAGETYESVADASALDLSGRQVYYHVNKLGSLAGVPRAKRALVDATPRVPSRIARAVALASELAVPSAASRMAGRARIPRRIDRLEGVEA